MIFPQANSFSKTKDIKHELTIKQSASFKAYKATIYKTLYSQPDEIPEPCDEVLEITKNNNLVFREEGCDYYIGHHPERDEHGEIIDSINNSEIVAMGKDVTGAGVPNLVIYTYSGGAHCCSSFYVFEIGETFNKLAEIDAKFGELSHFEKRPGEKSLVFLTGDDVFSEWLNWSSGSFRSPEVILRFRDGKYRLALDLMAKPVPSTEAMEEAVRLVQSEFWDDGKPPLSHVEYMLDLIYSGNSDSAMEFFDKAWPPFMHGKTQFLTSFFNKLTESPYWHDLANIVGKPGRPL